MLIQSIIAAPTISAICYAALILFQKTNRSKINVLSAASFVLTAVWTYAYSSLLFDQGHDKQINTMACHIAALFLFPIINLSISEYTHDSLRRVKYWLLIGPAGISILLGTIRQETSLMIGVIYMWCSGLVYTIDSCRMMFKAYRRVRTGYKHAPHRLFTETYVYLYLFGGMSVLILVLFSYLFKQVLLHKPAVLGGYLIFTLFIMYRGHFIINQNSKRSKYLRFIEPKDESTEMDLATKEQEISDEDSMCLTQEIVRAIEKKLQFLIVDQKWYLNPHLTMLDVCEDMGICKSYLSRYFNVYKQMSFTTYINQHRIDFATKLMQENIHGYTVDYVAQSAGFNNRTTFYRAFKKEKGIAPTEYLDH